MTMRVVISYFRSGGTLLNRCLGALPNVVIMSEVSPYKKGNSAGLGTIRQQAEEWYGITLSSDDFVESARELQDVCESSGRHLVLRLWVVGEFAQGRKHIPPPTYRLTGYHMLREAFRDVRAVALVRDAIDIWLSRGCQPSGFFENYRRYVDALLNEKIPVEKYEQLCKEPDQSMQRICEQLRIPYSDSYRDFSGFVSARGDLEVATSRARDDNRIRELKRRRVNRKLRRFIDCSQDMVAANGALGYPTTYSGAPLEPVMEVVADRVKAALRARLSGGLRRSTQTVW